MNKLCHLNEVAFNRDVEVGEFIPMSQLHNAFHIRGPLNILREASGEKIFCQSKQKTFAEFILCEGFL